METTMLDAFRVRGFATRTRNADEADPQRARLGALWGRFFASDLPAAGRSIYGVYGSYESDHRGAYGVIAGIAMEPGEAVPADQADVEVPAGTYAVFDCRGPLPQAVIEGWGRVWAAFEAPGAARRAYRVDVEQYLAPDHVRILIGLDDAGVAGGTA